jgi:hypothetical protein
MHKIFSTRLDEDLVRQIDRFVRERSITKKSLIEKALRAYLEEMGEKLGHDIVDRSFGAGRPSTGASNAIKSPHDESIYRQ